MSLHFNNIFPSHIVSFITDKARDFKLNEPLTSVFSSDQMKYLLDEIKERPLRIVTIHQVHGDHIIIADKEDLDIKDADAVVTNCAGIAITIRTADCLPIFLYDQKHDAIGLVHAGWKSSKLELLSKTVMIMEKEYATKPEDLTVVLAPCIGRECYEVGEEFSQRFSTGLHHHDGHWSLDLKEVNCDQLIKLGVARKNIHAVDVCTFCNQGYHSYRRDGDSAGRMLSVMMLKSKSGE